MKISFLGVNGYPIDGRKTISSLIEHENKLILLDCGLSLPDILWKENLHVTDLDVVLVSHVHADHAGAIPLLFFGNIIERFLKKWTSKKTTLSVFLEQTTYDTYLPVIRAAYSSFFSDNPPSIINLVSVANNISSELSIEGASITAMPLSHSVPVIGFRISWGGKIICYLSDTRPIAGLSNLAKDADMLICNIFGSDAHAELAHRLGFMTAGEAARIAVDGGAKSLVMQHLFFFEKEFELCKKQAQNIFKGEILIPTSGDCVKI